MATTGSYTATAKALHWIIAVLVLVTFPVGLVMTRVGQGPLQNQLFTLHKAIGPTILVLLVVRIVWRLSHPPPPLTDLPRWQARAAHWNHLLLYLTLAVMVVSGYVLTVAGGYPLELLDKLGVPPLIPVDKPLAKVATGVHLATKFLLLALVALHVGAALHHRLVRRDGVMARMAVSA